MSWFNMPLCVIGAYADMYPELSGRRSLNDATIVAVGTGSLEKRTRDRVMKTWSNAAGAVAHKPTPEERIDMMSAVGITVERS